MAVPGFLVLIGVELVAARLLRRRVYRLEDSVSDLSCGLGDRVIAALFAGLLAAPYLWLHEHARFFELDPKSASTWIFALLGQDLAYYAFHRFSHRAAVGWAAHGVHHQSEDYNLAVALRQSWFAGLYSWVFYLPLALLGLPFEVFVAVSALNLLYQFWIHTRLVHRLGPLEWVLNTPSHHRVHHGCQPAYIDKNYAGIFIVWDRLFGTFEPEREEPVYGVIHPIRTWNPASANLGPYAELVAQMSRTRGLWDKVQLWFRPPGWTPEAGEPPHPTPGPGRGYEPVVSRGRRVYVICMFAPTIAVIVALMAAPPQPWSPLALGWYGLLAAWVLGTITVLGGLLDGRSWAGVAEVARVVVSVLLFGGLALVA